MGSLYRVSGNGLRPAVPRPDQIMTTLSRLRRMSLAEITYRSRQEANGSIA